MQSQAKQITEQYLLEIAKHYAPVTPPDRCIWDSAYIGAVICSCGGPGFESAKRHFKLRNGPRFDEYRFEAEAEWDQFRAIYYTFNSLEKEVWEEISKKSAGTFARFLPKI